MKNKILVSALVVALVAPPMSAEQQPPRKKKIPLRELMARELEMSGGYVEKTGSQKGRIVFLDTQNVYDSTNITVALEAYRKNRTARYNFVIENGKLPNSTETESGYMIAKKQHDADILVVCVADQQTPTFLAAPEEGFAVVNAAKVTAGLSGGAIEKFGASRYRKELIRAVCFAAGATGSQFKGNVFSAAKLRDLDECREMVPVDTLMKAGQELKLKGVTPSVTSTYETACEQGWAPAPTSDVQKAIWDKVHAIPTKPIKIEFDPKTDTK